MRQELQELRLFAGSSYLCPLSKQSQMERNVSVHAVEECRTKWDQPNHQYLAYRLAETLPDDRNHNLPYDNTRREVVTPTS